MRYRVQIFVAIIVSGILGGASGIAADRRVDLDDPACRFLTKHIAAPDVAYVAGADIGGKPVVPADLGGRANIATPEAFEIEIDINLADRFGIPTDPTFFDPDAKIGTVRVEDLSGETTLTFNGQKLASGTPVSRECAALREKR